LKTTLSINGRLEEIEHAPAATLLGYLRERIGLTGSKPGCWRGECGACTVLVDGRPRVACITLIALIPDADVRTVEGLEDETLDLRRSFADHGGFQCGFCTPGQIVSAHAAMSDGPVDEDELRHRMSGNICRCTGYGPIITAIETAGSE
jgi:aerobic-type carbon monoxide dehydrogenase small subunit (CoxS/CutS family)